MTDQNIQLRITHSPDELSSEEATIFYKDIVEGYDKFIPEMEFKYSMFKLFIEDIQKAHGELTIYDYSRNKNQVFRKYENDKIRLYVRGNSLDMYTSLFTVNEVILNDLWKIYLKYAAPDNEVDIFTHSYYMSGLSLENSTKTMKPDDLNYISEKYYPYIDTNVMFDQFFTGAENILLIVGEPGLGKSKMSTLAIKHAYHNPDNLPYDKIKYNPSLDSQFITTVFVKSLDVLTNDKFWRSLESSQADFVIIDDLDYMLTKRDTEIQTQEDAKKNVFLNQFLSYTDGVEKNKTKFIITTNQSYDDIDTALLRKGRLFDILELRKLDRNEAFAIWEENGFDQESFDQTFKTHEILPADVGSEINKRKNMRINTTAETYLREDGISKVVKAGRAKKIGL